MTEPTGGGPAGVAAIVAAWRQAPDPWPLPPPASEAELDAAERSLGRPLPSELRALYGLTNGPNPLGGNLSVLPLSGNDEGLIGMGARLRQWGWPIPEELLVFGGNGAEEHFGVWYPASADRDALLPVVMVGAVFEPACMALIGTSLARFLRAWSAYYLLLAEAPSPALDALGLPGPLRHLDDDAGLRPYLSWADPDLPDADPDPYARGLDHTALLEILEA